MDEAYPASPSSQDRALADPRIRKVYEYWLSKRLGGRLPARKDMDPVDIYDCLASVMILNVIEDGADFRVRLAGTQVEEAYGQPIKGLMLSTLVDAEAWQQVAARLRGAVASGEADFRSASLAAIGRDFLQFDRVALPLSDDGIRVSHLFCCYAYSQRLRPKL